MNRGRPFPLWYRNLVLAIAAVIDRRAQGMRAHVKAHTPYRRRTVTAAEIVDNALQKLSRPPTASELRERIAEDSRNAL